MTHSRQVQFARTPTFSSERGLRLGRVNVSGGKRGFSGDIYIEKHQGKHADGAWEYRGRPGSTFLPAVASRTQLDLFRVIVVKVFWVHAFDQPAGVDKFFEFPDIRQMSKNGQDGSGVHVQASHQSIGGGEGFFQFHCYPDSNALGHSRVTVRGKEFSDITRSLDMSLR